MATFQTIWQEVRKGIGNRFDIDTEIKAAVNDAVVDVVLTFRMRQAIESTTLTTVEGSYMYEIPSDVLDIISVRNDTDAASLHKGDYLEFSTLDFADNDETGTPAKWFAEGTYLYLYNSTPDDTNFDITYRYLKRYSDMSSNSDVFPLPREWERPVKLFAKSYIFELLGQNEKAIMAYQQGVAVARSRTQQDGWGDLLRGDNAVSMPNYGDEGF